MKKLVFVLPTFNPGGAENVMIRLANHFCNYYDVSLLVINGGGVLKTAVAEEVKVVDLKCEKVRNAFFIARSTLRKMQVDCVFSSISRLNILLSLINRSQKNKFKLILREVNTPSAALTSIRYGFVYKMLYRCLYPYADKIVCQSRHMWNEMQMEIGLKPDKLVQIYNPLNERFLPENTTIPYNPYSKQINLLSVGRFEPQKGFDILLDAFAEVEKKHCNLHLVILGDGQQRQKLESRIKLLELSSKITMPGFINDIYPYLYHADVVVSSSRYEGLPNILIEAIACGTPIVATNCPGGTAEIVVQGVNGYLSEKISAESLAHSLNKYLTKPSSYDRESIKKTSERFQPNTIYRQYHQLFSATIGC